MVYHNLIWTYNRIFDFVLSIVCLFGRLFLVQIVVFLRYYCYLTPKLRKNVLLLSSGLEEINFTLVSFLLT